MDIKLEKPRRKPSVGDVYLYDAKHYMVVTSANYFTIMDLAILEVSRYKYINIEDMVQVSEGEYVGTLRITT